MRYHAEKLGLEVEVDSAGTGTWHVGDPPDARAIVAARGRGIEISAQRARRVRREDFGAFSWIIAMDRATQDELEAIRPPGSTTNVQLMSTFLPNGPVDIPDPYFSGKFEPVLDMLDVGLPRLLADLQAALQ